MAATPSSRPGLHHLTVVPTNFEAIEGDESSAEDAEPLAAE